MKRSIKYALEQMKEMSASCKDAKYLFEIYMRCKLNPDTKERKEVLSEFWSLVLYECWDVAASKVEKWCEPEHKMGATWAIRPSCT